MNVFSQTPAPRARDLQKARTRARILEVARSHFEREGFDGANVRAIAAEAGVAAGTVLLHFADKRDLLFSALHDDLEAAIERALTARPSANLGASLRALARPFFEYYAARPVLSRTLLKEALLADPPWRDRFTAQVARVHAHVVALVEAAVARGEVAAGTDAALLGAAFFSFYYFTLIGWLQGAIAEPAPLFERLLSQHLVPVAAPAAGRKRR